MEPKLAKPFGENISESVNCGSGKSSQCGSTSILMRTHWIVCQELTRQKCVEHKKLKLRKHLTMSRERYGIVKRVYKYGGREEVGIDFATFEKCVKVKLVGSIH